MKTNHLSPSQRINFSRLLALNWLIGSALVLSSPAVFAAANLCEGVLAPAVVSQEVPRTEETLNQWRRNLDPEAIYTFRDHDPSSQEEVYYNWGPAKFIQANIDTGISGKNLRALTKQSSALALGLYVANNMFGRSFHGDAMMEVVVYKDQRPGLDKNSNKVPVTTQEFRQDKAGARDSTPRIVYGEAHKDYVILDPRAIKEIRWPAKKVVLQQIQSFGQLIAEERPANLNNFLFEEKIKAYQRVISQVFISESFTLKDQKDFIRNNIAVKDFVAQQQGMMQQMLLIRVPVADPKTISGFQVYDKFFKATLNENTEFIHYDGNNSYFSLSRFIEAAKHMTADQLQILKQTMPPETGITRNLAEMIALGIAVREGDRPRVLQILDNNMRTELNENTQMSKTVGWRQGWRDLYNAQLEELNRTVTLVNEDRSF